MTIILEKRKRKVKKKVIVMDPLMRVYKFNVILGGFFFLFFFKFTEHR